MKNIVLKLGYVLLIVFTLYSCENMNENIQGYLDQGEYQYIGTVDTASTVSGQERIKFCMKISSDPRIETCNIYWNEKQDSIVYPINRNELEEADSLWFIAPISEGSYIFTIYLKGHGLRSVGKDVSGSSFGEYYQSTLIPRKIIGYTVTAGMVFTWGAAEETLIRTDLIYESISGNRVTRSIPPAANTVTLDDYQPGGVYYSTSYYLPAANAMDTFSITTPEDHFQHILKVDKTNILAKSTAAVYSVDVGATLPWSAVSNQPWCVLENTSGTINIRVAENPSPEERTAIITVSAEGLVSQTITVTQRMKGGGVNINGTVWAEYNVDAPGTFSGDPELFGMYYQWNRRVGWTPDPFGSHPAGFTWNSTADPATIWEPENDPSPEGWRIPTAAEYSALIASGYRKIDAGNTVEGYFFGPDAATATMENPGRSVFLPSVGNRGAEGYYGGMTMYLSSTYNPGDNPVGTLIYWSATRNPAMSATAALGGGYYLRCVR
jgi:hypothetical protein